MRLMLSDSDYFLVVEKTYYLGEACMCRKNYIGRSMVVVK
eukprot:jgi/Antlo1/2148/874